MNTHFIRVSNRQSKEYKAIIKAGKESNRKAAIARKASIVVSGKVDLDAPHAIGMSSGI